MADLTLGDMRAHVYDYFVLDTDDISNDIIDRFAIEGYQRLSHLSKTWGFYDYVETASLTSGQYEYDLENVTSLERINSVFYEDQLLQRIPIEEARQRFIQSGGTVFSGTPEAFTVVGRQDQLTGSSAKFYVWPQPDSAYDLEFDGTRNPNVLTGAAGEVADLPEPLQEALLTWIRYRVYLHQDDPEMAQFEKQHFEEQLSVVGSYYSQSDKTYPTVYGGGFNMTNTSQPRRLRYEWE